MPERPLALITGASAGLGAEFSRQLAARGYDLVLCARRLDRLETLAAGLAREFGTRCWTVPADLSSDTAIDTLTGAISTTGRPLDLLVNNAGYGVPGAFLSQDWRVHVDFQQVMISTVVALCYRFAPLMRAQGKGSILNVSSLAGHMPGTAGHTLYGPAKAWLIKFSECLGAELAPAGVRVLALCPGFTYTEFHDANGMRPLVSRLPAWLWMDAPAVVREGLAALDAGRRVHIPGRINRALALAARLLPGALLRRLVARREADFRKVD